MSFLLLWFDCAALAASPDECPAAAALLAVRPPPHAASGRVEFKVRLLNFLCRQLTSLARQSQPFQQGVKPN
jgi:hypothetical protein